jgi:hypothetical protein
MINKNPAEAGQGSLFGFVFVIILLFQSSLTAGVVGDVFGASDNQIAFGFISALSNQPAFLLGFAVLTGFAALAANRNGHCTHEFLLKSVSVTGGGWLIPVWILNRSRKFYLKHFDHNTPARHTNRAMVNPRVAVRLAGAFMHIPQLRLSFACQAVENLNGHFLALDPVLRDCYGFLKIGDVFNHAVTGTAYFKTVGGCFRHRIIPFLVNFTYYKRSSLNVNRQYLHKSTEFFGLVR